MPVIASDTLPYALLPLIPGCPDMMNLSAVVPASLRLRLHLIPLVAVFFLAIYSQIVCPFLSGVELQQIIWGLMLIALLHLALREWLFRRFSHQHQDSPIWVTQKASVTSWLVVGIIASVYHGWLYPEFPLESHLKLLVGYWALGAGILAQVDHIAVEQYFRKRGRNALGERVEHISRRLMQLIAVFALVPGLVMAIMAFRFVSEGYANPGVAYEVSFLVLVFFLLATLVAWQYGRTLKEDTQAISAALKTISAGEFDVKLDTTRPDELGKVAVGINHMAQGLVQREKIRDLFGRFVSPQVAEHMIERFDDDKHSLTRLSQRTQVAVLMADIRNFSEIAEQLPPEKLVALLNGYFAAMVGAIEQHQGVVGKFIGDAVMAVFGSGGLRQQALPESDAEAQICRQAVAAGQLMRERLLHFNQTAQQEFGVTLENGIGIHFGDVVAGCVGSDQRLEFTVMGNTVNIAARIESLCKAPNPALLFSATVAQHIEAAQTLGEFELKGIGRPLPVYHLAAED